MTFVVPVDLLDPDGCSHHFKAGEQDVPVWVTDCSTVAGRATARAAYEATGEGRLARYREVMRQVAAKPAQLAQVCGDPA